MAIAVAQTPQTPQKYTSVVKPIFPKIERMCLLKVKAVIFSVQTLDLPQSPQCL